MKMHEKIEELIFEGYEEISTDSGTGSRILINNNQDRAAKINQDGAYNHFINFVQSNSRLVHVPIIHNFKKYGVSPYDSNKGFTFIEMEKLFPLDDEESVKYIKWIKSYWTAKRNANLPPDDFGILSTIEVLIKYAVSCEANIDLDKATNVMKRSDNTYIITDPYN